MNKVEEIAKRSLVNCHVVGLDSILFDDTPEKRIRVFIAHEYHELWRNALPFANELSVAVHPHHCHVTLIPIYGRLYNIVERVHGGYRCTLQPFLYESAITGQGGKFSKFGNTEVLRLGMDEITGACKMDASQIHTVFVPKGERAAWWVHEGKEDAHYEPICYSNADLEQFDFSPLYQPMTAQRASELMRLIYAPELAASRTGQAIDESIAMVEQAEKRAGER